MSRSFMFMDMDKLSARYVSQTSNEGRYVSARFPRGIYLFMYRSAIVDNCFQEILEKVYFLSGIFEHNFASYEKMTTLFEFVLQPIKE